MKFAKYFFCLGNPGAQYDRSPHNLGFLFADRLMAYFPTIPHQKTKLQATWACLVAENIAIMVSKPSTFMNLSGQAVREVYNKISSTSGAEFVGQIIVVHDDVDLTDKSIQLKDGRVNGGHRGHNGLRNIGEQLGYLGLNKQQSVAFWRIRLGCKKAYQGQLNQYVLQNMPADEWDEWGKMMDSYITSPQFRELLLS